MYNKVTFKFMYQGENPMSYIPEEKLKELCESFDGSCGVYISLPFANEKFTYCADQKFRAASTIKIPLLALLLKDAEEGITDIETPIPLGEEGAVCGSGIIKFLSPDVRFSLYDYAILMMIVSDNTATNRVIDAVGIERANAFFAENGWSDTYLYKKLFVPAPDQPYGTASTNLTSARDLGDMMSCVYEKSLVSEDVSNKMLSIMACQQLGKLDKSLRGVYRPGSARAPITKVPDGRIIMAQKGGTLAGKISVSHDAAIMLLPDGRCAVMVVMTESADNNMALEFIKSISKSVYDALDGEPEKLS